jgi:hypothetical protein
MSQFASGVAEKVLATVISGLILYAIINGNAMQATIKPLSIDAIFFNLI